MYEISMFFENNYEAYELKDDLGMVHIKLIPSRGGIITEFSVKGREILYLNKETLSDPEGKIRGGIPVMFPFSGKLKDDTYTYQGNQYTMPRHGFARLMNWEVVDSGKSETSAYMMLRLSDTPETLKYYPFKFEVYNKYELIDRQLIINQQFMNKSDKTMPFYSGFHPYLLIEDVTRMALKINAERYINLKSGKVYSYPGSLDFTKEIDITFTDLTSNRCSIDDTQRNLRVNLEFSDKFKCVNFWRIETGEFICIDPCMAPENAINSGIGVVELAPSQMFETSLRIWTDKLI